MGVAIKNESMRGVIAEREWVHEKWMIHETPRAMHEVWQVCMCHRTPGPPISSQMSEGTLTCIPKVKRLMTHMITLQVPCLLLKIVDNYGEHLVYCYGKPSVHQDKTCTVYSHI